MASINFNKRIEEHEDRIKDDYNKIGGKGLLVPMSVEVSGARKLLSSIQRDAALCLMNPELPIIRTGFENRYGEYSSSITTAEDDYQVLAKISKFSFSPNHHYWLICKSLHNKNIIVYERVPAQHRTEQYGFLYNNAYMDSIYPTNIINKNQRIKMSLSYDTFGNRMDGLNMNVLYMALDDNMEDSIIISDYAARRFTAPLCKEVNIIVNENDIPLNYYGTSDIYKCMPDIGEHTKNSILLALRKENKSSALFSQSVDRLKDTEIGDDKYLLNGTVIDIDIHCNNPENLNMYYNGQFRLYYNERQRCAKEFIDILTPLVSSGYILSDELKVIYGLSKRILNNDKYIDKRKFSNIEIKMLILEERELQIGDKISNRYGGKGVISHILPREEMPSTEDGEVADILMNSSTMYNRENPPQLFEMSITRIGELLLKHIYNRIHDKTNPMELSSAVDLISLYLKRCNRISNQDQEFRDWCSTMSDSDLEFLINSMCYDRYIYTTVETMRDVFTIDDLNLLYKDFPFIQQSKLYVSIKDSRGNIRKVEARRKGVMGKEYMLRLKQYAEEHFSATSLSATNIKNANTKSKSAREYRTLYSHTPIRMGDMEINNFAHIGTDLVINALLLHSVSPHARKLVEEFSTGNPYITDIQLDDMSTNRSAEIVETYLKAIGLRLKFIKKRKIKKNPINRYALIAKQAFKKYPIIYTGNIDNMTEEELIEYNNRLQEYHKKLQERIKKGELIDPLEIFDIDKAIK